MAKDRNTKIAYFD